MPALDAVFDTNVFVAAGFRRSSASARLVELARSGSVRLIWNQATRAETRRVLERIPRLSWGSVEELFLPEGEFTGKTEVSAFGQVRDFADRKFAALAAAADVPLVSSDHDLLEHRGGDAFDVRTPSELLAALDSAEDR